MFVNVDVDLGLKLQFAGYHTRGTTEWEDPSNLTHTSNYSIFKVKGV